MCKQVTVLIPNYKTPQITTICLRLVRKYTNLEKTKIIVIDNDSRDESLQYLKSLNWITLIERLSIPGETSPQSHSRALDLGLSKVDTPYVLSIHTDTFVKRDDWIDMLISYLDKDSTLAGVGSWKLESKTWLQLIGYRFELNIKLMLSLFGICKEPAKNQYKNLENRYLRSHCAIYKMEAIKKIGTSFSDGNLSAGEMMHKKLIARGYKMGFLDSVFLGKYVDHLNHATMVLNPGLGSSKKNIRTGKARIKKMLRGIDAQKILSQRYLDE